MPPITALTPETAPEPHWPEQPTAAPGAPNVVIVLTDDVGYGATSTFGGVVPTPTVDALAERGLRYTRFHTTAMCSPTRAALLTGRNHHKVAFGRITETAMAYDGYTSVLPDDAVTLARVLKDAGYATAQIGKHHNTPDWEASPTGPFDRWPTGLGFEHWYGYHGGGCNNWAPGLYRGITPVEPPADDPTYHLEADLADEAIRWVRRQKSGAPDKPFFLYYATAAGHAPHHAPQEWIERFRGQYDHGWDAVREEVLARQIELGIAPAGTRLTERPEEIPAWASLSDDERRLYARQMEVFAASVAYSDAQIGRFLDSLRELGELDNTIVVFIQGDNGASSEGGPHGALNEGLFMNGMADSVERMLDHIDELGGPKHYNHYSIGWAHAMDTPFQWFKQVASHFGGTRNGMVLSWPAGIGDHAQLRDQFHHVVDVAPTILDLVGVAQPHVVDGVTQQPVDGVSMRYSFADAAAPSLRATQYFELHGNRAIYHDGWVAACGPLELPWAWTLPPPEPDAAAWQLFHIDEDFSQAVDLAAAHPERLRTMQDLFLVEAAVNGVLPLLAGTARRSGPPAPSAVAGRSHFVYYDGTTRIPPAAAPDVANRSFTITADVDVPEGASGFLVGHGGHAGGHALYLVDGRLTYHYNLLNTERATVTAEPPIAPGRRRLQVRFDADGAGFGVGGTVSLSVDGAVVAGERLDRTVPWRMSYIEGLNIGRDTGTPISPDYRVPFVWPGTLHQVEVELR